MGGQRNSFALNVAGQRIHFNHYSLDGVENTDLNFNSYMLLPSVDALEEFNVISGLFDAEYGRAIAQVNVSTKSGSNRVARHGVRVPAQFQRSMRRTTSTSRAIPIPPFKRNQYGFTLSGPVVVPKMIDGRNRLFFMVNWEGLRENKSLTQTPSLPLTAWRTGRLLRPSRRERQPDPDLRPGDARVRRRRQRAAGADAVSRQHHSRRIAFTPSRKSCCAYYPRPSQEVTGANFVNNEARQVNADQFTYRLDFTHGASTWTFRHSLSHEHGYDPFAIPNMGINTDTDVHQIVFSNTRTIGSNKLNDARFGFGYLKNGHISPRANNENVVKALGINLPSDNPLYWGVPNINVTGLSGLGEESDAPFINDDKTIQFVDNFTWTVASHSFKLGGELRHVIYDQIGGVVTRGRFAFDGRYTQNPLAAGRRSEAARRSPIFSSGTSIVPKRRLARRLPTSAPTTSRSTPRTAGASGRTSR